MKRKSSPESINNEDDYMMALARANGGRFSTCNRARVGAVISDAKGEAIAHGWNASPKGTGTCDSDGHIMVDNHCIRTIHAETMALSKLLIKGKSTKGCTVYITHQPCITCLKLLAISNIKRIVFENEYKNIESDKFYNQIISSYKITLEKYIKEKK